MPIDLTQYERVYSNKKEIAIKIATHLIEIMEARACCLDCKVIVEKTDVNIPKEAFQIVCDIMEGIMCSSGYYINSKITTMKNGKLKTVHEIKMMSDDEKANLMNPIVC